MGSESSKNKPTLYFPVQPVCLPDPAGSSPFLSDMYATGLVGDVSGWGLTDEADKDSGSKLLQFVSVPITTLSVCRSSYQRLITINSEIQVSLERVLCPGKEQIA